MRRDEPVPAAGRPSERAASARAAPLVPHDHADCVREALARAALLCEERGVRLTPIRRNVLALVWESHRAIKAYDILERLGRAGGRAKPPTVYRALDFLMAQGLVHRVDSLNAFVGCSNADNRHVAQFFICDACGVVRESDEAVIERAVQAGAKRAGFKIARQMIEVHGECGQCRA